MINVVMGSSFVYAAECGKCAFKCWSADVDDLLHMLRGHLTEDCLLRPGGRPDRLKMIYEAVGD